MRIRVYWHRYTNPPLLVAYMSHTGILRIEYSPVLVDERKSYVRMRVIYVAEPVDENQVRCDDLAVVEEGRKLHTRSEA